MSEETPARPHGPVPCCIEFAANGYSHTEYCPAFEINDPARRVHDRSASIKARDWGDWTPGKGVERLKAEMPGVMPDLTEEHCAAADAVIAAAGGSAVNSELTVQDPRPAPDRLTSLLFNTITRAIPHDRFLMLSERMDVAVAVRALIEEQLGYSAAWDAGEAYGRERQSAFIANDIRAELVCCDIYEHAHGDEDRVEAAERSGHAICFWGEAAARIAEARDDDAGEPAEGGSDA